MCLHRLRDFIKQLLALCPAVSGRSQGGVSFVCGYSFMRDVPHGCQYGVRDIGSCRWPQKSCLSFVNFLFYCSFPHHSTREENNANFMWGIGVINFLNWRQSRANGFTPIMYR